MSTLPAPPKTINPLWIICLFFSFSEVTLGVAVFQTTGGVQTALASFVIFFPIFIAAVFFLVLWFRPEHLYAPHDFGSDESFLRSMSDARGARSAQLGSVAANITQAVQAALASTQVAERLSKVKGEGMLEALRNETSRISNNIQQTVVTVDLSSVSNKLSPMKLPVAALRTMGTLTNEVYFVIERFVRPYAYGYDWILRDKKTRNTFSSRRVFLQVPPGVPCKDDRSLGEMGIVSGMDLEVVLLKDARSVNRLEH